MTHMIALEMALGVFMAIGQSLIRGVLLPGAPDITSGILIL